MKTRQQKSAVARATAKAPRARTSRARQRQHLIDACISALHLHGPSRTTVERVVAIAKMSPGIVRFYFDSKAAMLVASLQFLSAEFEDRVLGPVGRLRTRPVEALRSLIDLYLDPDIASPRKVSVWYAFWGEASSRQEYYDICGQKDERFALLVRELVETLISDSGQSHLDPDGIALGLIGALEILWQDIAFQTEHDIDRPAAKRRCMRFLSSVFPRQFDTEPALVAASDAPDTTRFESGAYQDARVLAQEREALFQGAWLIAGHESQLARNGDFFTVDLGIERILLVRDVSGVSHALRNVCPQAPHVLVAARQGRFTDNLQCKAHGLAFSLSGRGQGGVDLDRLELLDDGGLLCVRAFEPNAAGAAAAAVAARPDWELPTGLTVLGPTFERSVAADWKLVIEQCLETADAIRSVGGSQLRWSLTRFAGHPWSAARYRRLVGCMSDPIVERRFVAPNLLIESRPDGVSLLQVLPITAGRCSVRRIDFTSFAPGEVARAAQYLAKRLTVDTRRSAFEMAESIQTSITEFGYERSPVSASIPAGIAWFRRMVADRVPLLSRRSAAPMPA